VSETRIDIGLDDSTHRMFEAVRDALARDHVDPFDRDAFLMHRSVVEMIHGGRPTGEVGEAIAEFTALLHIIFLFWLDGGPAIDVSGKTLEDVMRSQVRSGGLSERRTVFVRVEPRRIWGSPTEAGPEPLDGWYAARRDDRLMVAAQFGARAR